MGRVLKDILSFLISQELEILNLVTQWVQYKHSTITYELFDFCHSEVFQSLNFKRLCSYQANCLLKVSGQEN